MSVWQPGARPAWVRTLNELGDPAWIALDADALLEEASRATGLTDFGGEAFLEPYRIFVAALEREARLNLLGRVLARGDVLNWLENRLQLADWRKRHPEIARQPVERPIFITGLPRTGTSILHELLGQDPVNRVPLHWEVRHPCPPPERSSYSSDPRIERSHREVDFWNLVVPEYNSMHELGGHIPVECVQIMAHEFRSEELPGRHQVPTFAAWLAQSDMRPAYEFHRRVLQHLQWRCPGACWVLKAPSHLTALPALLSVYPDARVVWTHRDPLVVIPSVASILYSTAWVRSDEVDAERLLGWFTGETCERLLDGATSLRESGAIDSRQLFDVRYADLMRDPLGTIAGIYDHFGLALGAEAEARMRRYLDQKPRGKHGAHRYSFADTGLDRDAERRRFTAYQARYAVPSEV